jgi:hypothetical protein
MANSGDTVAVQTVYFTDLATGFHMAGLLGSVLGALLLATLTFTIIGRSGTGGGKSAWLEQLSRARPWLLMLIGVFILLDTGFDIVTT